MLEKMRNPTLIRLIGLAPIFALCACQPKGEPQSASNRPPSATEVFELRSKCAALGEKIMDENAIGIALAQEQISHYSPESNRCYVKLEVHTANLDTPQDRFTIVARCRTGLTFVHMNRRLLQALTDELLSGHGFTSV